jgi:hypothetical protein
VQYGGHFTAIERSREEIRAIHRMSPVWRWHFEQCSNPIRCLSPKAGMNIFRSE